MEKFPETITIENASDMCAAMSIINDQFVTRNNICRTVGELHMIRLAHFVNFAVKDCLFIVHQNITAIRALLSAIRSFVKRRDLYGNI